MSDTLKLLNVVGARPNFLKIAPLMEAYDRRSDISPVLVHTGQHYDANMSGLFFEQLGIPKPDFNLDVGSGSHAEQTALIMERFEPIVERLDPSAILVVGDVNGTLACSLVAVKMGIPVVHVEAGLRSFDRSMPEEINRIVTDSISELLFCTEQSGVDNLKNEGIPDAKIHFVGNVMIDSVLKHRQHAAQSSVLDDLQVADGSYALVTLHRPSNVDHREVLAGLVTVLIEMSSSRAVVFPVHPRTRRRLEEFELLARLESAAGIRLVEPLGYLDFLKLLDCSRVVLTDSGGIQEETTILGVPCLTLRPSTERPVTISMGTNRLVGSEPDDVLQAIRELEEDREAEFLVPPLWDGGAAERIASILIEDLS